MPTRYPTRVEARVTAEMSARIERVWRQMQAEAPPGVHVVKGAAVRAVLLAGLQQMEGGAHASDS